MTPQQALDHPSASVLERAIGIKPKIEIDMTQIDPVNRGDGILLCTDGLSGHVNDKEIADVLGRGLPVNEIPKRLFDLALRHQSKDNITIKYLQYGRSKSTRLGLARLLTWKRKSAGG